jgi:hypothetical protein
MITQLGSKPTFTVDLGRPTILNEQALKRWSQIHTWVRTSNTPVAITPAFGVVDSFITRNEYYQGAGYRYMFGFRTKEDRDAFVAIVEKAKKDYPSNV